MGARPPGRRKEMAASCSRTFTAAHRPITSLMVAFHQAHGAGNGGADDVLTRCGEAAVSLCIETDDAGFLCEECNGRHAVTQKEILPISTLV